MSEVLDAFPADAAIHPGRRSEQVKPSYVLTFSCPDRRGIVHTVTHFLSEHEANIDEAAQFSSPESGRFFMRMAFTLEGEPFEVQRLRGAFASAVNHLDMCWQIVERCALMPTVLMVSKLGHCLHDLLLRWKTGLLPITLKAIVSNHADFASVADAYAIPFHHVPVTPATKLAAEKRLLQIVSDTGAELVVLARYMQVLSNDLCARLAGRAINIHHSFLPGFKGAKPYHQAFQRGVKLIGATAHYVTADLDEGPIIEQDVERADHAMGPAALTALGRDVESIVLARAVKWHAERRVILDGNRTVVFR